jgi:hypothetical protein
LSSLGSGWNFAVATWDASNNINLYINGTKYTSTRSGSINVGNLDRGYIAERALEVPLGEAFQGEMQNVRCWTVELSQAQVDLLYARPWEGTNYGDLWPYSPPAAGSMTLSTDTAATSLLSGMQAWFPLTEGTGTSAQCILHPTHTGTLGSSVSWESSEIGTSVVSDGAGLTGGINTGNPSSVQITGDLTIAAWVKCDDSTPSSNQYIVSKYGAGAGQRAYAIALLTSGSVRFTYQSSGNPYNSAEDVDSSATLTAGTWHFVVGTFQASTAGKIYIDGELDTSNTSSVPSSIFNSSSDVYISGIDDGPLNCFDGNIQNVKIYNRVLSADEITILYERPWEGIEYGDTFHYDPPAPASMLPLTSDSINTNQELWLPLTETDDYASGAKDINGSSDGTQSGGVLSKSSVIGGVASFDGTNDIIATSGVTTDFSATDYTASLWVRLNSTTGNPYFLSKWGSVSGYAVFFWLTSGTQKVRVQIGTTGSTATVAEYDIASELTTDFRNLALVLSGNKFSSSSISLYMDGVLLSPDSTTNGTGALLDGSGDFAIAGRPDGISRYVDGDIGNVRLWSRALTADEVWSIYSNPWLGSNYKLAAGSSSTPLYNYIFRTERFRRLG